VDNRNTSSAQLFFQTKIEIWCVNANKNVWGIGLPSINQRTTQFEQPRDFPEGLYQAHYGKRFGIFNTFAACRTHCWPCYTLKSGVGHTLAYFVNEARAQQIAGGLTSNQANSHWR
jgi:hypothetical protein